MDKNEVLHEIEQLEDIVREANRELRELELKLWYIKTARGIVLIVFLLVVAIGIVLDREDDITLLVLLLLSISLLLLIPESRYRTKKDTISTKLRGRAVSRLARLREELSDDGGLETGNS